MVLVMMKTNDNLYNFSTESVWGFIAVVILYVIGAASFPSELFSFIPGTEKDVGLVSISIAHIICSIVPLWLMFEIKVKRLLFPRVGYKELLLLLPYLIVALNNIPFFSFALNKVAVLSDVSANTVAWYIVACFSGAFLEESVFRGLVFPSLLRKFEGRKNDVFIAALISSALFGLTHFVNLFGGASVGAVAMQVGYSFLVGGMCAVAMYISGSIIYSVLLHFIFNFGGLMTEYEIISGTLWTPLTIILTIIITLLAIIFTLIILFKAKRRDLIFEKINYPT